MCKVAELPADPRTESHPSHSLCTGCGGGSVAETGGGLGGGWLTLVEARPQSGRTHQIRPPPLSLTSPCSRIFHL